MPLSITLEQTSSRKQQTLHVAKPKRTVRLFTVRLPEWFLHRQYDLQLMYATSGWPFTLNTCNVVQADSPFFNACRTGDIDTIKVLLSNQQASIYDRTPDRATSFHFAIGSTQLEVCKLLRHAGIFAQFDDIDYLESLNSLERSLNDFTEYNFSLLRVVAPLDNPDQDWFREYYRTSSVDPCMVYPNLELFSLLNSAQSDTAMLNVSHLKTYFECRDSYARYGHHSFMSYIIRVLSDTSTVHGISAAPDGYAWIVYALASETALAYFGSHWSPDADEWSRSVRQALSAVVNAGLRPHQTSGKLESPWVSDDWYQNLTMTPLGLLCIEAIRVRVRIGHGTPSEWNRDVRKRLQVWLLGLHTAGIDLLQYAKSESACFGFDTNSLTIPWVSGGSITVVTGPRPEHWHVSLWAPCESHAGQFWRLIEENPVVPALTTSILVSRPVSERRDPTSRDLPGSWPSDGAGIAEELESWFLRKTDEVLAEIEEDLSLLSGADFLATWPRINHILELGQ
jgi:hypothetical protein